MTKLIIVSALELLFVIAVLWGIFNEDKLYKWERKFFRRIKRGLRR